MTHDPAAPRHADRVAARPNRLIREVSPYLQQHARNPVDWYPWGDEAFAAARVRDVPILLSIGYSTCYWCHVMERESFESGSIATLLNARVVAVKVDREERPDLDDLYMAATIAMTGRGGWPMTVFLEPHTLRPFWAGTYFPPEPRHGIPSFPQVIEGMAGAWAQQRDAVLRQAEQLADAVRESVAHAADPAPVGVRLIEDAVAMLLRMLDRTHGGFGAAPKFPQPAFADFLLDVRDALDDHARAAADAALRLTLDRMALGGIRDHVGGGFHRYATDAIWLVPHFEKMLYDNAQLASLYARAADAYDDDEYRRVVRDTMRYVNREMSLDAPPHTDHDQRGFASAQDAEVNHREGQNYLWTAHQLREALGDEDGSWAASVYGVDLGPNFRDPHHPNDEPANVLRLNARPDQLAADRGMTTERFLQRLNDVNARLLLARGTRDQPLRDDKAIAGWNGMMIAACAHAARCLGEAEWAHRAAHAARFVLSNMLDHQGRLIRAWRAGRATGPGFLDDSAMMARGLLALHGVAPDFDIDAAFALHAARRIIDAAERDFGDGRGGYFDARAGQSDLFVRPRSTHDGAVPSGSSAIAHALLDLAHATGEPADARRAVHAIAAISGAIARGPVPTIHGTHALHRALAMPAVRAQLHALLPSEPPTERHTAGRDDADARAFIEVHADRDRVVVALDHPAELWLALRIADGIHLIATTPDSEANSEPDPNSGAGTESGPAPMTPLRVGLVAGSGVDVYADYPPATELAEMPGTAGYQGELRLRVALERNNDPFLRPILGMVFQACTDRQCLRPTVIELDVAIDGQ